MSPPLAQTIIYLAIAVAVTGVGISLVAWLLWR
jgi:hypothetical protein